MEYTALPYGMKGRAFRKTGTRQSLCASEVEDYFTRTGTSRPCPASEKAPPCAPYLYGFTLWNER